MAVPVVGLPRVQYTVVDLGALVPPVVVDTQAQLFGFNRGQPWEYAPSEAQGSGSGALTAGEHSAVASTSYNDGRYIRWLRESFSPGVIAVFMTRIYQRPLHSGWGPASPCAWKPSVIALAPPVVQESESTAQTHATAQL